MYVVLSSYHEEAPFGHIPILSVDGVEVCGSINIARFIAERHGESVVDTYISEIYYYTKQEIWGSASIYVYTETILIGSGGFVASAVSSHECEG